MSLNRVFPVLTVLNGDAVKTRQFESPIYLGDPVNTVRLWSDLCVDEIVYLDISEVREPLSHRLALLTSIAEEAFVPLSVGGGVTSEGDAACLFSLGIEKVVIGWSGVQTLSLVSTLAVRFGSQAISVCVDYSYFNSTIKSLERRGKFVIPSSQLNSTLATLVSAGAGEIIVQCVDRDGMLDGFDSEQLSQLVSLVSVPLVLLGGDGNVEHVKQAHQLGFAAAAGRLFSFSGSSDQVLIGNPFLKVD